MPLVRRPYEDNNSNSSYKPDGGYLDNSTNDPSAAAIAGSSIAAVPQLPTGFVNTDRLLAQNQGAIANNKQQIGQIGNDISSTFGNISSGITNAPNLDIAKLSTLPSFGDIIQAGSDPNKIKQLEGMHADQPASLSVDQNAFDPIYSKINSLGANVNSNPFNYGLLKTSGAINDQTFPGWNTSITDDMGKLNTQVGTANQDRSTAVTKANQDYKTGIDARIKKIIDEYGTSGLNDPRYSGPISIPDEPGVSTAIEGGTPDQRGYIQTLLKNLTSSIGGDPNNVQVPNVDTAWFDQLRKQKAIDSHNKPNTNPKETDWTGQRYNQGTGRITSPNGSVAGTGETNLHSGQLTDRNTGIGDYNQEIGGSPAELLGRISDNNNTPGGEVGPGITDQIAQGFKDLIGGLGKTWRGEK